MEWAGCLGIGEVGLEDVGHEDAVDEVVAEGEGEAAASLGSPTVLAAPAAPRAALAPVVQLVVEDGPVPSPSGHQRASHSLSLS